MCKLSIIIPCYRVERWLRPCLDSVLLPGRSDYEVIPVNDGSPDSCEEIVADYARRRPDLIRPLRQPNSGLGTARNAGLDAARGEYLLFLDGDDFLAPGAVEEMLAVLEEDADVFVFDFLTVNEQGRRLGCTRGVRGDGRFLLSARKSLLLDPPNAWNKLWRRSLFRRSGIRYPPRLWYEDLATTPGLYLRAESIRAVHRPWLCYRLRSGSITHSHDLRRNAEIIPAVDMALDRFYEQGLFGAYGEALEAMTVYHQLLTATVRVNRIDPHASLQGDLLENLNAKFPHWRENPALRRLPFRQRLLLRLIVTRQYALLHRIMALNDLIRRKHAGYTLGNER